MTQNSYDIIAQLIDWLVAHYEQTPSLDDMSAYTGYSPEYLQKIFKAQVGISPKQFVRYLSYRHARDLLVKGHPTLEAAYDAGLSGNGRLHDLFMRIESMTPGGVSGRGHGLTITVGWGLTCMGDMMVAKTDKGICWIGFRVNESRERSIRRVHEFWPKATTIDGDVREEIRQIDDIWRGNTENVDKPLRLDLYGTNMQLQVWQALLRIPIGHCVSYQSVAKAIGKPKASRAVGNAVGANPVTLLIPCHRVIRQTGIIDNYGWGSPRKKAILGIETAC